MDDGMGEKERSQVRQYLPSSRQSRVEGDPQQSRGNPRFVPQLLSDQWEREETWENLEGKAMTDSKKNSGSKLRLILTSWEQNHSQGLNTSP